MDPNGFLTALGEFLIASAGDSVETLVDLWNGEMARRLTQSLLSAPFHKVEPNSGLLESW